MKKAEIAKRLARRSGVSQGEAADQLDRIVRQIRWNLRRGKQATFPGLGRFTAGPGGAPRFENEDRSTHD